MKIQKNSQKTGFLFGIIVPFVVFGLVYLYFMNEFTTLKQYFLYIKRAGILMKIISLCLVPNLLVFFLFLRQQAMQSARGVLGATFIVGFIMVLSLML